MGVEWEWNGREWEGEAGEGKKKCYDAIRVVDDVVNSRRGY